MTDRSQHEGSPDDPVFEGVYGPFTITARDRREVLGYRLALLGVALAQGGLLLQWANWGSQGLWPWLVLMAVGLGLALRWIHIYLRPLHRALQLFWLLGCAGGVALALLQGQGAMLDIRGDRLPLDLGGGAVLRGLGGRGLQGILLLPAARSDRGDPAAAGSAAGPPGGPAR